MAVTLLYNKCTYTTDAGSYFVYGNFEHEHVHAARISCQGNKTS